MQKIISLFLCIALMLSLLTGCSGASQEKNAEQADTSIQETSTKENAPASESAQQTASYAPDATNIFTLHNHDNWEESFVITFDDQKLCVSDWDSSQLYAIELERIDDFRSVLRMRLENMSLAEACQGPMDRIGGSISQTEPRKDTLCGRDIYYYEILTDYDNTYYFFAMELGENLVLTNHYFAGYRDAVPFEEMMADAFLSMEAGDGTFIRPPFPYETSVENNTIHIQFDSGETFSLPCAHEKAEVYADQNCVGAFLYMGGEEDYDNSITINANISDNYPESQQYLETRIYSMTPVQCMNANGMDVFYYVDLDWKEGAFYIPLTDGYALCGMWHCNAPSIEDPTDALYLWLSGESADAVGVDYGYVAPTDLGYEMESMTYRLDGALYQFPTPVSELAKYGWKVPDFFQNDVVPAGGTLDMGLENGHGGIIYNVTVQNPTGRDLAPKDCLVIRMIVATDSNVMLDLPEGLSLYSSDYDMGYTATNSRMIVTSSDGSSYGYYSWNSADYTTTIWGYFDTTTSKVDYFEFTHY